MNDSWQTLREAAQRATPGPWDAYFTHHGDPLVVESGKGIFHTIVDPIVPIVRPSTSPNDYGRANCRYIAAANPEVVLQLLDQLAATEKLADMMEEALKDRRRTVLTRGGGVARRIVADPTADRILADYHSHRRAEVERLREGQT